MSNKSFQEVTYLMQAIDPIHVGSGGYRLGRVDNTVIRDYDDVPKIPGTSIEGATRAYVAMQSKGVGRNCAGKSSCGQQRRECPVCAIFGFSDGSESRKGIANFYDARILLFPVKTMKGVVWITTESRMNEYLGEDLNVSVSDEKIVPAQNGIAGELNLGWILIEVADSVVTLDKTKFGTLPEFIYSNIYFVSEKVFSLVVNDNLEVRTSVSIDPKTGAASSSALFTYEAIPRTTIFWFDVVYSHPKNFGINFNEMLGEEKKDNLLDSVIEYTEKGMNLYSSLGLGGMSTRGFGRTKLIHDFDKEGGEHE